VQRLVNYEPLAMIDLRKTERELENGCSECKRGAAEGSITSATHDGRKWLSGFELREVHPRRLLWSFGLQHHECRVGATGSERLESATGLSLEAPVV